jgi:hypothetical protein
MDRRVAVVAPDWMVAAVSDLQAEAASLALNQAQAVQPPELPVVARNPTLLAVTRSITAEAESLSLASKAVARAQTTLWPL